jgi:hypothetical protein
VGDSFFDGLYRSGVASYFIHVYRSRWENSATLENMLANLPPDCRYLLVEFIELQAPAIDALSEGSRFVDMRVSVAR